LEEVRLFRCVASVSIIAVLRLSAAADVPETKSPWIDLAPTPIFTSSETAQPRKRDHKLAASLTLAGLYAGFMGWTYLAWYRKDCPRSDNSCPKFKWADPKKEGDWRIWTEGGWFGKNGYAGGADKLGHAWATLSLARVGTEMLHQWGGYDRLTSAIVGSALSEALFFGVELRDGTSYSFSQGDFVFNTLGAGLAFAQSVWPSVDEAVDFRVEYVPSGAYRERFRKNSDLDVAEDYSGQTYHLAFHLGAIDRLSRWRYGKWSRFVDVTLGFETNGYKPDPLVPPDPVACEELGMSCDFDKERNVFIGVSLNAQAVFDYLLRGRSEPARRLAHGALEVFSIPGTTLRMLEHNAVPSGLVPDEQ
jgi:hypothetical protein